MFQTTKQILDEYHRNGIFLSTIYGKLGVGKSTYCIKVAYQVYKNLGYSDNESWRLALNSLVFKPIEFINLIDDDDDYRVPVIILDDASFHLGATLYKNDYKIYTRLRKIITTVRTKTSGLLINAPSVYELAKFLRGVNFKQIKITGNSNYQRYATGYEWYSRETKNGPKNLRRRKWIDKYSCYLPNDIYNEYLAKRRTYLSEPIEEFKNE